MMNRADLLAKCPKLAEVVTLFRGYIVEHVGRCDDDEDVNHALDELLALINPPAEPEPANIAGLVAIDGRRLCTFATALAERRKTPRGFETEAPWEWALGGCLFSRVALEPLRDVMVARRDVAVACETPERSLLRWALWVPNWESSWLTAGAPVSLRLIGEEGSLTLTGRTETAAERREREAR